MHNKLIHTLKRFIKMAQTDLLFPPYSDKTAAQYPIRKTVPLLENAKYCLYANACTRLVKDWLDSKVGSGAPSESWEKEQITAVSSKNISQELECLDLASDHEKQEQEITEIYRKLINKNAPTHLRLATSHRKWIRMSTEFCKMIGVKFSGDIGGLVKKHDLSKYTAEEILGYAVMFGDKQVGLKQLHGEEKIEWDLALEHHYIHNPHHPEYFYVKQTDGKREKFDIIEVEKDVGKLYLEESLIDMMASRGERELKDDQIISVGKWLDINEKYLLRYSEGDKKFVLALIDAWRTAANDFVADESNAENLRTLFGRDVEI